MNKYINCQAILKQAKSTVKAFVFDFDGTIKSSAEPEFKPLELIEKIILHNKFVGIVTASGVSALINLAQQIIKFSSEKNWSKPVYLGIANGVSLYTLDGCGQHELYAYPLGLNEIGGIVQVWERVMKKNNIKDENLVEKGLKTFNEFLSKDWGEHIADDLLLKSRQYSGKCFVEKLKVTFVMPKNEVFPQERFIELMQKEMNNMFGRGKLIIDMGDTTFAHVTRRPKMAPKLFALKRIKKELGLKKDEVIIFGDMPLANDKGLLIDSHFPFTFTNKYFDRGNVQNSPFILPTSKLNPVASVYRTVDYLLT